MTKLEDLLWVKEENDPKEDTKKEDLIDTSLAMTVNCMYICCAKPFIWINCR